MHVGLTIPAAGLRGLWRANSVCRRTLEALSVAGQALTGPLPPLWGLRGAFKSLLVLDLSGNNLTGTVPASWGGPAAFPELEHM